MEEQQLKQKQEELAQHQQKVTPSLLTCLSCHHQHHQHYHLDLHHILTKSPSPGAGSRTAPRRGAAVNAWSPGQNSSCLGLDISMYCLTFNHGLRLGLQVQNSFAPKIFPTLVLVLVLDLGLCYGLGLGLQAENF